MSDQSSLFNGYFNVINNFHNYLTRNSSNLALPRPYNEQIKRSISYSGTQIWNNLDIEIRNCSNLNFFKRMVKANLQYFIF